MLCCMLLAALLGAATWPLRRLASRSTPLAWRPYDTPANVRPRFAIDARFRSFSYAFAGLRFLMRNEHNAWVHAALSLGVIATGIGLGVSAADWRWLILSIGLVWMAEAVNTAIEQLCDLVSPAPHPIIKASKDLAAGAVLVCAVVAALIGALTIYPYLGGSAKVAMQSVGAFAVRQPSLHRRSPAVEDARTGLCRCHIPASKGNRC